MKKEKNTSVLLKKDNSDKRAVTYIISAALVVVLFIALAIVQKFVSDQSMVITVLKKGIIYSLIAVSMNLLNGFTGLFSLGQAGFMLLGAYTYAILTIPSNVRDSVYYLFQGSSFNFSFVDSLKSVFGDSGAGGTAALIIGVLLAIICSGIVAAIFAYLIGLPVLRLKSDYLAIATLGFAEILRAIFQWDKLGVLTNGSNLLRKYPVYV